MSRDRNPGNVRVERGPRKQERPQGEVPGTELRKQRQERQQLYRERAREATAQELRQVQLAREAQALGRQLQQAQEAQAAGRPGLQQAHEALAPGRPGLQRAQGAAVQVQQERQQEVRQQLQEDAVEHEP